MRSDSAGLAVLPSRSPMTKSAWTRPGCSVAWLAAPQHSRSGHPGFFPAMHIYIFDIDGTLTDKAGLVLDGRFAAVGTREGFAEDA